MNNIYRGDCLDILEILDDSSVNCCVTSPPYFGLRDYGHPDQIGAEALLEEYVLKLVSVFKEVKRILRDDGTLWLNLGDRYSSGGRKTQCKPTTRKDDFVPTRAPNIDGIKPKDLIGIPWRVAFALQSDGWYLRSDIIWSKPNPMPESVTDRPTRAHEYIFLLSKSKKYYYDKDAIREQYSENSISRYSRKFTSNTASSMATQNPSVKIGGYISPNPMGKNKQTVWTVNTSCFNGAHFATFPEELIKPCILAGCPVGGTVLDPFFGAGTTGLVALKNDRKFIGIELNPEYIEIAKARLDSLLTQTKLPVSE